MAIYSIYGYIYMRILIWLYIYMTVTYNIYCIVYVQVNPGRRCHA